MLTPTLPTPKDYRYFHVVWTDLKALINALYTSGPGKLQQFFKQLAWCAVRTACTEQCTLVYERTWYLVPGMYCTVRT